MNAKNIYQLHVQLVNSHPLIFRKMTVPSYFLLSQLHEVIQMCMGWEDRHLHVFEKDGVYYADQLESYANKTVKPEQRYTVAQLLTKPKETLMYEYDLDDHWVHKIILDKIIPFSKKNDKPICTQIVGACPPEGLGGITHYADFLEAMADRFHPQHAEYRAWIGGEFNTEVQELDYINQALSEL